MQDHWKIILSPAPSDLAQIRVGDNVWAVRLVRHVRAKRYRLVVDAARSELRLTLPRRASVNRALRWAREQQAWLEQQLEEVREPVMVGPGTHLPFRGGIRQIHWDAALPRRIRDDGAVLFLGGAVEQVARRVERWLKAAALALLTTESEALAAQADLSLGRVGVGDPRSRWGSCSAAGDLRYSWRLIMAPDHVRRATVAHEVAHLRHMDHGPAFHALVSGLHDDDVDEARRWLRREGRGLHCYRFAD